MSDDTLTPLPSGVSDAGADSTPYDVDVNTDPVRAQVAGKPAEPQEQLVVHETRVVTDKVITDVNDPLAVIVPPAGRGDAVTPIGAAYAASPQSPNDFFGDAANAADVNEDQSDPSVTSDVGKDPQDVPGSAERLESDEV